MVAAREQGPGALRNQFAQGMTERSPELCHSDGIASIVPPDGLSADGIQFDRPLQDQQLTNSSSPTPVRDALRDIRDEAWDTWDTRRAAIGAAVLLMKVRHPGWSWQEIQQRFVDRTAWLAGDSDAVRLRIANDAFATSTQQQFADRARLLASEQDERLARVAAVKRQAAILESDVDDTARVLDVYRGRMSPNQVVEAVATAYTARVARLHDEITQLNTERQPHRLESDGYILGTALCTAHDAVAAHQVRREAESSARSLGTRMLDRVINWSR